MDFKLETIGLVTSLEPFLKLASISFARKKYDKDITRINTVIIN